MDRRDQHDAEVISELPSRSSTSSYHTAVEPEPSACQSCWVFFRSLISSPFYKTEVSTLSLVHLICTLAIGISLSIAVEIQEAKNTTKSNLYLFLVVYMWISNVWIFGAFCCGNKFGCCLAQRQLDGHVPGYLIIGVTFLCIGSCFITAVDILPYAFSSVCEKYNSTTITGRLPEQLKDELRSEAIYSATKFVFLILQLYFFCRFSSKTFMDTCSMKIFLMHIIAVNLCTWFYIIVDESVDHEQTHKQTNKTCLPFAVINKTKIVIDEYLYPFSIEYSVMSSVLLFLLWFRLRKNESDDNENRESPENEPRVQTTCCQRLKIFFYEKCCNEGRPQGENKPMSFWRSAICGYVLGVVMLVFILLIITVLGIVFKDDQTHSIYFYLGSRITVFFLMSIVCLFGLKYLRWHDPGDQTPHTIVDTALIMIGVSGCYLRSGFQMTAAANDYQTCTNATKDPATNLSCIYLGVVFTDYVCSLVQYTLQAFFIVRALRRCSLVTLPSGKISSALVVRRCSAFLSIANIGIWAMDTFELRDIKETNIPETSAYSIDSWRILSHVAFPLCIFFRLHSVFCCCEIVINRFAVVLPEDSYRRVRSEDEDSHARENVNSSVQLTGFDTNTLSNDS